jgi:hypothetical protein
MLLYFSSSHVRLTLHDFAAAACSHCVTVPPNGNIYTVRCLPNVPASVTGTLIIKQTVDGCNILEKEKSTSAPLCSSDAVCVNQCYTCSFEAQHK